MEKYISEQSTYEHNREKLERNKKTIATGLVTFVRGIPVTARDRILMLSKADKIQKNSFKIKIGAQREEKIYIEFGHIPKTQYEVNI